MPSVIGTAANNYNAGGSGALTVAHNSGAAGNGRKCMVAFMYEFDATQTANAPTYNGTSLTQFAVLGTSISTTGFLRCYRLLDASLADGSNTFSITRASAQDELMFWVQTFDDVNQTTPLSGAQSASGNSNTATIPAITLPGGSDWAVGGLAAFDGAGYTTTASDTSVGSVNGTVSASGYAMQRGTDANLSWTLTNTPDWFVLGAALIHDAGGGATIYNRNPFGNPLFNSRIIQ